MQIVNFITWYEHVFYILSSQSNTQTVLTQNNIWQTSYKIDAKYYFNFGKNFIRNILRKEKKNFDVSFISKPFRREFREQYFHGSASGGEIALIRYRMWSILRAMIRRTALVITHTVRCPSPWTSVPNHQTQNIEKAYVYIHFVSQKKTYLELFMVIFMQKCQTYLFFIK